MSENKKKLVIFDFDGVIINTLQLCYDLNIKSNPDLSWEEYSKMSHGNFYESFQGDTPTVVFNQSPSFQDDYHSKIREFDTPLEIQKAIKHLSGKYILTVVSSGSEDSIKHFLEKEGLLECFSDILGYQTHKSKVIKITDLLKKYSVAPRDTVFITDTLGDILEGTQAAIQSVGVTWGLHGKTLLSEGKPAAIIDDPALLEETVETILNS